MQAFHHPQGSQQALLVGLAHLYNLVLRTAHTAPVWRGGNHCCDGSYDSANGTRIAAELYWSPHSVVPSTPANVGWKSKAGKSPHATGGSTSRASPLGAFDER